MTPAELTARIRSARQNSYDMSRCTGKVGSLGRAADLHAKIAEACNRSGNPVGAEKELLAAEKYIDKAMAIIHPKD